MLTLTENRDHSRMTDERAYMINHFAFTGNSLGIEFKNLSMVDCYRVLLNMYDYVVNEYNIGKIDVEMFINSIDTIRYHIHGDFDVAMSDYLRGTANQYFTDREMMSNGGLILIDTDNEPCDGFIENDITDFFDCVEFGMFYTVDCFRSDDEVTVDGCVKSLLHDINTMHTVLTLYETM